MIQIHKELKKLLVELYEREQSLNAFDIQTPPVVRTERSPNTSRQSTINMFIWYRDLGFIGCPSRRIFRPHRGTLKWIQTDRGKWLA
jgi:hypothetical protein